MSYLSQFAKALDKVNAACSKDKAKAEVEPCERCVELEHNVIDEATHYDRLNTRWLCEYCIKEEGHLCPGCGRIDLLIGEELECEEDYPENEKMCAACRADAESERETYEFLRTIK